MAITVQSTYATDYAKGYPGMIANGETSNRISRTVEDSAGIAFGKAVFRGSGDHGVTATPAANTFMGVTIADRAIVPTTVSGAVDTYPQYSTAGILFEGCIYVIVGEDVTDGAAAYVTSAGAFVDTSSSNTAIPAVFDETVASGGVCRLRIVR
ncbi:conserved hypothetical protein [Sphingobium sp. SYK-6]|uniref:structural cement protein Gp24 n=1 Tax=Sphingobium sp. (strain NBRC 103272 / SYK-6) TaxID=627192 RepID=UPI000227712D|nr:hypothetical protein [Sphingobium sp. SYK-6]BAK66881.1 conserved hypothetical protein [Sphingobium sp. SYK-6]